MEIVEANPEYAHVRLPDDRVTTVSLRHVAPQADADSRASQPQPAQEAPHANVSLETTSGNKLLEDSIAPKGSPAVPSQIHSLPPLRRSERTRQAPKYLQDYTT